MSKGKIDPKTWKDTNSIENLRFHRCLTEAIRKTIKDCGFRIMCDKNEK